MSIQWQDICGRINQADIRYLKYNLERLCIQFLYHTSILQVAKVHHGTKIHHVGDIKGISRDKVPVSC